VNHAVVNEADDQPGAARHGRVHGVARQAVAQDGVLGVRRQPADRVTRVDVAHVDGRAPGAEVGGDAVFEEQADVGVLDVARGVRLHLVARDQVLAGALGDDDHRVALAFEPPLKHGQQAALAVQLEGLLGDQAVVDLAAGQRRAGGDEARVAAHQLDQPDAVQHRARFRVGDVDHLARGVDGRAVAERARHIENVVVDGLRDADDGERVAQRAGGFVDPVCAALRAVAADGEEEIHAELAQRAHHDFRVLGAAGGAEDGAAQLVDVADVLRRQLHRRKAVGRVEAVVAVADAVDALDAVEAP